MRITNNITSLKTLKRNEAVNRKLEKTLSSLSTGLRVNSSSDDAAGFAISQRMKAEISGLDIAMKNSQTGISLLQTAEGALSEINSMLQRMRELSIQASNDSLISNDRQYIQLEIDELKQQIDKISSTTQFNNKRILDGSLGALWSTDNLNVKAKINGGLTYTNEFGDKVSSEGNYRIEIKADGGKGQVQKSNIIKFDLTETYTEVNIDINSTENISGFGWISTENELRITGDGTYNIIGNTSAVSKRIVVDPGVKATIFMQDVNIDLSSETSGKIPDTCAFYMQGATVDLYIAGENTLKSGYHRAGIEASSGSNLTISSASGDYSTEGKLTAIGGHHGSGIGGACGAGGGISTGGSITIKGGTIEAKGGDLAAGIGAGTGGIFNNISIEGGNINATGGRSGAGIGSGGLPLSNAPRNNTGNITIKGGNINAVGGSAASNSYGKGAGIGGGSAYNSGNIAINNELSISAIGYSEIGVGEGGVNASVNYSDLPTDPARKLPQKASEVTETTATLSEIPQFYNSNGVPLISPSQNITITQGDGQTATVTLYETDTIYDAAEKINDAISNSLGQGKYVQNTLDKFCTISDGAENTSESVYNLENFYDDNEILTGREITATMLIRSAIPGKAGELYFSGDQDLLNALGLNTIQNSEEATYTASVYDAHSGKPVAINVKSSEPEFPSLIPPEIDIEVDSMSGLSANWDENTKRFITARKEVYTAFLHLKDNGTIFQVGANKGEDFVIQLGDSSCSALGISSVNVATRETASRSIGLLDKAINKIASQRAKIGACENSLELNINNLTITSANLTTSESLITNADMSKEMMNFVKLQIISQSGSSMLAQSNQLPKSVLSLMQ